MDYISVLKVDISKGFSKSQLEVLIGLPKNNLTEILKGNRQLSQKSKLKIEQWELSEKPNPLNMSKPEIKVRDLNEPTHKVEAQKPMGTQKSNVTITTIKPPEENNKLKEYQDELELLKDKNSPLATSRRKWLNKQINSF